jgi:hypothetical protein
VTQPPRTGRLGSLEVALDLTERHDQGGVQLLELAEPPAILGELLFIPLCRGRQLSKSRVSLTDRRVPLTDRRIPLTDRRLQTLVKSRELAPRRL